MNAVTTFKPAKGLRSPHIQSILASSKLRRIALGKRGKRFEAASTAHLIDTPCGATLQCWHTPHPSPKGMVTLIHGWEGSAQSLYMLDTGSYLFEQGYSVTRLNMRDHGDTHHLNDELFHSARISEVAHALAAINLNWPHASNALAGFSLGANFALRAALYATDYQLYFDKVIAVCPPINPSNTMQTLNEAAFIYEKYFVKKWRKSLVKKAQTIDSYNYLPALQSMRTLDQMNEYFIGRYTNYPTLADYFAAYTLPQDLADRVALNTHIIATTDDPVCPIADINALKTNDKLAVEVHQYGGHCGFLHSPSLQSWVAPRIFQLVQTA